MGRRGLAVALAVAVFVAACASAHRPIGTRGSGVGLEASASPPGGPVVVVAPHPDDEVLIAAAAIARARAAGRRVHVVLVTNGDATCERDGFRREGETVAALTDLGLTEQDVTFLGYPDGHVPELGIAPLPPVERRARDGSCTRGAVTYGARGRAGADEHTVRTGGTAPYTASALAEDLAAVLARVAPTDVHVAHPIDDHPDHAFTYAYLRRALERQRVVSHVVVHRGLVHAEPCWPMSGQERAPCPVPYAPSTPMPPLPPPWAGYTPGEILRLGVESPLAAAQKLALIGRYRSQFEGPVAESWLAGFARAEEVAWPEILVREQGEAGRFERAGGGAASRAKAGVAGGGSLGLGGSYALRVVTGAAELVRSDVGVGDARAPALRLARWLLPHDDGGREHVWELSAQRRDDDGGVTEITARRDGELVGVAVDVATGTRPRVRP